MSKKNFYITTPLYYPNSKPHIGTLYPTVISDVFSRLMQLYGKNVVFTTGLDEHGQKIQEAAERLEKSPQEFVDEKAVIFKNEWSKWDIEYTAFARTTSESHIKAVQNWIRKLRNDGMIYKAEYEGWYSVSSEEFINERDIAERTSDGIPICPISGKTAIRLKQEAYFFKLSVYQEKLLAFYKKYPNWILPSERAEEVISFVKSGLKDLCISRSKENLQWGIPFPDDDKHVVYVWADALNGYMTSIGYGQENNEDYFDNTWPADIHVIGKEIVRFHAVYWPAFLIAGGLKLPKSLLVHGWILFDDAKMSKSLGNIVSPEELIKEYGVDKSRYYLIRHIPATRDSSFSFDDFTEKTNAELCNSLGNLVQRILSLIAKVGDPSVSCAFLSKREKELYESSLKMIEEFEKYVLQRMLHLAYASVWKYINEINAYIHETEPWKLVEKHSEFNRAASAVLHAIYQIGILVWPVMPKTAEKMFDYIGIFEFDPIIHNIESAKKEWKIDFAASAMFEPIFEKK
jgi:methionyl-tRNA synthetase